MFQKELEPDISYSVHLYMTYTQLAKALLPDRRRLLLGSEILVNVYSFNDHNCSKRNSYLFPKHPTVGTSTSFKNNKIKNMHIYIIYIM